MFIINWEMCAIELSNFDIASSTIVRRWPVVTATACSKPSTSGSVMMGWEKEEEGRRR